MKKDSRRPRIPSTSDATAAPLVLPAAAGAKVATD